MGGEDYQRGAGDGIEEYIQGCAGDEVTNGCSCWMDVMNVGSSC